MDIFEELGIRRYINAQDTFTKYGGSCMGEKSLRAMREISQSFVSLEEVQEKAGDAIARLTHNEAAYLTNGAAGGLLICAAACLAKDSEKAFHALPETDGRKEILLQSAQKNPYDRSLAACGAKLVYADGGTPEALEAAISDSTVAVAYFIWHGREASLSLEQTIEIAHRHQLPVIVDAAAQNPPAENLWKFTGMGADMVIFSGGKSIRGPQDSGLVVGRREWIARCRRWGPPTDGICRSCKTSREAMAGLYAALKEYLLQDEQEKYRQMEELCSCAERAMRKSGFAEVERLSQGPVGQRFPRSRGRLLKGSAVRLAQLLLERGIYVGVTESGDGILFNPLMLSGQQAQLVCEKLEECVKQLEQEG